jgi:hypothetical protein
MRCWDTWSWSGWREKWMYTASGIDRCQIWRRSSVGRLGNVWNFDGDMPAKDVSLGDLLSSMLKILAL